MPKINGVIVCINDHTQMVRNDGFNAVTSVTKQGANISFNPANGVPTRLYYCQTCGYIEMYAAAIIDQEWNKS